MTNTTTPIQAAFEFQRQSIKQSQQLFEQSLELQQNVIKTCLQNGISAQRSAQQQGTELAQSLFNAQLDAFQSALDAEEIKKEADQLFEQNAEQTQQLINAQYDQGTALTQQLFDAQYDAFASALDDEQFRAAVEDQFEEFDDIQSETWDEFESEFAASFEELTEQQKELVDQSVEAFLDAQSDAEQQTVEGVQQAEEVAQTAQQQTQEIAVEGVNSAESVDEPLESIEGLGEAYADRLREQGIESITHLAQANTGTIADAAEVSEDQAEEWIKAAQSQA